MTREPLTPEEEMRAVLAEYGPNGRTGVSHTEARLLDAAHRILTEWHGAGMDVDAGPYHWCRGTTCEHHGEPDRRQPEVAQQPGETA